MKMFITGKFALLSLQNPVAAVGLLKSNTNYMSIILEHKLYPKEMRETNTSVQ